MRKTKKISTNQPATAKQKASVSGKCPKLKGSNHYFQRKRARQEASTGCCLTRAFREQNMVWGNKNMIEKKKNSIKCLEDKLKKYSIK